MSRSTLIDRYVAGPKLVREAVAGMSREQLVARPVEGKWSTLEVVAHLADFEVVGVDRLTAPLAEREPTLPGRDEQAYAARLAYHERDLEEQLRLIEACRTHTARILRTLSADDWQRVGIHTEAGPMTVEQLLERFVRHIEHHVPFIHEKRKAMDG
jgi:hypothetical protein